MSYMTNCCWLEGDEFLLSVENFPASCFINIYWAMQYFSTKWKPSSLTLCLFLCKISSHLLFRPVTYIFSLTNDSLRSVFSYCPHYHINEYTICKNWFQISILLWDISEKYRPLFLLNCVPQLKRVIHSWGAGVSGLAFLPHSDHLSKTSSLQPSFIDRRQEKKEERERASLHGWPCRIHRKDKRNSWWTLKCLFWKSSQMHIDEEIVFPLGGSSKYSWAERTQFSLFVWWKW